MWFLPAYQVATQDTGIYLMCNSSGVAKETKTVTANSLGKDDELEVTSMSVPLQTSYNGQTRVEIGTGVTRIRLPEAMLPSLHGGRDGWYELRDLDMGEQEIEAKIAINFLNHPKVRLDRMAGTIEIDGSSGTFQGSCTRYEAGGERKF